MMYHQQHAVSELVIAQAWHTQMKQVASTPWLARALLRQSRALFTRFTATYQYMLNLPRPQRRKLLRSMGASLAGAALALALNQGSLLAADIDVNTSSTTIAVDDECSLLEALVNANSDAATYTDCAAGAGDDTIVLRGKIYTLQQVNNTSIYGPNGLPVITTAITIEGNGATIVRDENAPEFRIIEVTSTGDLTLNATTISGGYLGPSFPYTYGAGIYNNGGNVTLTNSTVSNNTAIYFGAGLCNIDGNLTIENSTISDNSNEDDGAGIFNDGGEVLLLHSTVSGNLADGSEGGGIFNEAYSTVIALNSTISGNLAGFGGAGISNDGVITLTNSTVTQNVTEGTGGGIRTRTTATNTLQMSIVSGNRASAGNEIYNRVSDVGTPGLITVDGFNLFGDSGQSNLDAFTNANFTPGASDITATSDGAQPTALEAILDPILQNNGGATLTHALVSGSPALDAAPAGPETDQRGMVRARGANFDIGAFELLIPPTANMIYLSSFSSGKVGDISFKDEDILAYDTATGEWLLYFDGSDVGLGRTDVDAFYQLDDDSLLLSFDQAIKVPALGVVDDADIVRFVPISLGDQTAGTFEPYFDGSDVGLERSGEDVDAIAFTPDGELLISTNGTFRVDEIVAHNEDLMAFAATTLGAATEGEWSLYFDGSDLGLSKESEDLSAAWNNGGDLYLTTKGNYAINDGVSEVQGDGETIFAFSPFSTGEETTGLIFDYFDEELFEFERSIDGLALDLDDTLSDKLNAIQSASISEVEQFALAPEEVTGEDAIDVELNAYDSEDNDAGTSNSQIFLPVIAQ